MTESISLFSCLGRDGSGGGDNVLSPALIFLFLAGSGGGGPGVELDLEVFMGG